MMRAAKGREETTKSMATAASLVQIGGHRAGFAATERNDRWWVGPLLTLCGLTAFVAYAFWAGIQGEHYFYGSYLSPFYSPLLWIKSGVAGGAPVEHAWFGEWPAWWPAWIPASPTFLIIAFPLSFR